MVKLAETDIREDGEAVLRARLARLEGVLADEVRKSETLARVTEAVASSNDIDTCVQVVIDGARKANGMVSFAGALAPKDAEDIRAYILSEAHKTQAAAAAAPAAAN